MEIIEELREKYGHMYIPDGKDNKIKITQILNGLDKLEDKIKEQSETKLLKELAFK